MYTGIVQATALVGRVRHQVGSRRIGLARGTTDIFADVQTGASVAVDGTCLTVATVGETDIFLTFPREPLKSRRWAL
jgi:riboflavin synthase alpha subunit